MNSLVSITIIEEVIVYENYEEKKTSMKGLTGQWSKWGRIIGDEYHTFANSQFIVPVAWTCQSCAKLMPKEIAPLKYHFEPISEYIRICALCYQDGCALLKKRMEEA